jgi:hypothetical protein
MKWNKKKNRREKKIKKGMLEGTKTSELYTLNKKSTGCYLIHQTKICNTENTIKHKLASCTHNMQYFDGCHPVVMPVQINTQTLSDTTIHFVATQLHCFAPLHNNCQAAKHLKNTHKQKVQLHLFLWELKNYNWLICFFTASVVTLVYIEPPYF